MTPNEGDRAASNVVDLGRRPAPPAAPRVADQRQALCNLLGYADELLQLGDKPILDVAGDGVFALHEADLLPLQGCTIPAGSGDWLRLARLRPTPAPRPDPMFNGWIRPQSGPFDPPLLLGALIITVTVECASDLLEAGLAQPADVLPRPRDGADHVDIHLQLIQLPDFAAAFAAWVSGTWRPWALAEPPRRHSIAVYHRLFDIHQRRVAMGEDAPVEIVLGVGLARWLQPSGRLNAPLIEVSVELALDADSGAITVQSRGRPPQLVLRAFQAFGIDGTGRRLRDAEAELERAWQDPDIGFSPHHRPCFASVLRSCAAGLSATAVYLPDQPEWEATRRPPDADETLRITDTWVLYGRRRSSHVVRDDIRRLVEQIRALEDGQGLPPAAAQLAARPLAEAPGDGWIDLNDTTPPPPEAPAGGASERTPGKVYFLPLPCNDEQIEIMRRLEEPGTNGVVVQGPPGTGKTHTIANIIAHYMATGRRVLVSARSPEALTAIGEKLPDSIRDLVIAVIHSDRDGARRLEAAVKILADQVRQINVAAYNQQRQDLEQQLDRMRQDLAQTDRAIRDYAHLNLAPVAFRGERLLPMQLARRIAHEAAEHSWFPDELDTTSRFEPQFGDADIADAARIRAELGADLVYVGAEVPTPDDLPDQARLLAAHAALAREAEHHSRAVAGNLPDVAFGAGARPEDARALHAWLVDLADWDAQASAAAAWLPELYALLIGAPCKDWALRDSLQSLCLTWADLHHEGHAFLLRAIEWPEVAAQDPPLDHALDALAEGRKPFGALSFGTAARRAKLAAMRLDGRPPATPEQWAYLRDFRAWQKQVLGFAANWSQTAELLGWPRWPTDWQALRRDLLRVGPLIDQAHALHMRARLVAPLLPALFPAGVVPEDVLVHRKIGAVRDALAASLATEERAAADAVRDTLRRWSDQAPPLHQAIGELAELLGDAGLSPREVGDAWTQILGKATRLHAQQASRLRLQAIAGLVHKSGAPRWAAALTGTPVQGPDPWCPPTWQRSWDWARAAGFLRSVSDRRIQAALSTRRRALEDRERKLMSEIVRLRTFIGLKQGITGPVAAALAMFAMKVAQLGAGTGKSADRIRRAIREAALQAAAAVPCWVLPEWRVAEQLPSELGRFDLVIIDEASQSDVTALPVVLRGKKLLVVGDDKQVSPSAVGVDDHAVARLRRTYLAGMPIANFLEPTTSLYDLAAMTLPGAVTVLREHFRSVEPIIRFSARFYGHALVPLRVPTAAERLEPPLIDIHVPHGRKQGERNPPEAEVIVAEIARLVADPAHAQRSIGVVSLIGDQQARLIWDRLTAAVGAEAMQRHRIMCGNASRFQGQERDIMFLSMVACPDTARAQTGRIMEQRFNVAMSRARDRMYLVRSVVAATLSPTDLKRAVIEHFCDPMGGAPPPAAEAVLAETAFERDFARHLRGLGYQIRPRVPVGDDRIDFVIEGEGDRRLAVELDGDRPHGPDRWAQDHRRQRTLERMGWTFWRCWGAHWLADRQGCLDDLSAALDRLRIRPHTGGIGAQVWTEHRVAAPPETTPHPA